jgi:DNA polymerase V
MSVNIFALRLPLLGIVPAGWPSPAEEELGDLLSFEEWLLPHKDASSLVTVGTNALRSEGIFPKDIVIMERGVRPQHGSIVIAEVEGHVLIRRFEVIGGKPRLVSDDAFVEMKDEEQARVLGVVVTVIRRYR